MCVYVYTYISTYIYIYDVMNNLFLLKDKINHIL